MFETDFQQTSTVLMLKSQGRSKIVDRIYPGRTNHCDQLVKLGADIVWKKTDSAYTAYVTGGKPLHGAKVFAGDIRAGACLVLAGLLAEGKTTIFGVEHIERGYVNIVEDFRTLGADMRLIDTISDTGSTSSITADVEL